ncbi:MAG: DUF5989 family protein [Thermodesulfobacteriota bacterium]
MSKLSIISDVLKYCRAHKKLWLLPMLLVLVVLSVALFFAQTSPLAPFIYSII